MYLDGEFSGLNRNGMKNRALEVEINVALESRPAKLKSVSSGSVIGAFLSTKPRNRLSELQSSRIAFGIAPVPGAMQSHRPVLCCCQVDRLRIQAILPDAGLGELKRMGIVRRDGLVSD